MLATELGARPGDAARQAHRDASLLAAPGDVAETGIDVDALLADLAALASRQSVVQAELAAVGVAKPALRALAATR